MLYLNKKELENLGIDWHQQLAVIRNYIPDYRNWAEMIIIDDWDEVCRENTDIENMHLKTGLQQQDTVTLTEVIYDGLLSDKGPDAVIIFNLKGMAIFDIAIASQYDHLAMNLKAGGIS